MRTLLRLKPQQVLSKRKRIDQANGSYQPAKTYANSIAAQLTPQKS